MIILIGRSCSIWTYAVLISIFSIIIAISTSSVSILQVKLSSVMSRTVIYPRKSDVSNVFILTPPITMRWQIIPRQVSPFYSLQFFGCLENIIHELGNCKHSPCDAAKERDLIKSGIRAFVLNILCPD